MRVSESGRPLLTVITPVYNREDCVLRCLESVSRLADADIEHVVVDDGSCDGTFDIVQQYAETHPRVKPFRLAENSGTNAARNLAVRQAAGRFILLLDSDDTVSASAMTSVRRMLREHPDVKHYLFAVDDRQAYYRQLGLNTGDTAAFSFRDFLEGKVTGDFAHLLLRETMLKYPFDEKLRVFEGVFFLHFYKEAGKVMFCNEVVLERDRSRDDRVTYTLIPDSRESLRRHILALQMTIDNFRDTLLQSDGGRKVLIDKLYRHYKFATMLCDDSAVEYSRRRIAEMGLSLPGLYKWVNRLHAGRLLRVSANLYLKAKYRFKKAE